MFYPRFWDEAIYAWDAVWGQIFHPLDESAEQFAPAKLGYGMPLAVAVALFREWGVMYLSTVAWCLTIILAGIAVARRFSGLTGWVTVAFLAYSPLLGKYVAEASPTLVAAAGFVLLWVVYPKRRFWLTGLIVGLIALIDFKWALPAALAVVAVELTVEHKQGWKNRIIHTVGAGSTALAFLAVVGVIHPPYVDHLWSYAFGHRGIVGFEPSGIFFYYLLLFGAAPAVILSIIAYSWPAVRKTLRTYNNDAAGHVLRALVLGGVPIAFYSIFGSLKGLRFYAVAFPLIAITIGVGMSLLLRFVLYKARRLPVLPRSFVGVVAAACAVVVIVVGSDGPARHLRMDSGFPRALERLAREAGREGTVSSYLWPVVQYGWRMPMNDPPFALWGLLESDQWVVLHPMLDRVTIDLRTRLVSRQEGNPDSIWALQRRSLLSFCDSLYSYLSDFHSSDYFLSENVVVGIPVLRRWQAMRSPDQDYTTVYRIDPNRIADNMDRGG